MLRPRLSAMLPSTTYTTSSATFIVSQPLPNGYWWTTDVSISAAVSSKVSIAYDG